MRWLIIPLAALCGAAMAFESQQGDPWVSVYFDTDSAEVAGYQFPEIKDQDAVRIVGHADRRWTPAHNLALSERRARAVALAIGRPDAEIQAKGDTAPISGCMSDDADCLLEDRRADVFVTCAVTAFACTSRYDETWMGSVQPEYSPVRMVTDRSRF